MKHQLGVEVSRSLPQVLDNRRSILSDHMEERMKLLGLQEFLDHRYQTITENKPSIENGNNIR